MVDIPDTTLVVLMFLAWHLSTVRFIDFFADDYSSCREL